jgi:uncharacterized protein
MLLKTLIRFFQLFLIIVLTVSLWILFKQHSLIYFPRPYDAFAVQAAGSAQEIHYTTGEGKQCAFYFPPPSGIPARVWICFGGNGSLALDWTGFIQSIPDRNSAFLLIDYPGYGKCEGKASPASIRESGNTAAAALESRLGQKVEWNVLGHSLGSAAGLQFAAGRPVERVILVAPFTSMQEMARRTVGWPLSLLLLHQFDNRARLAELAARSDPPEVIIFHGSLDDVIPAAMGSRLAQEFPGMIRFHAVPGAGHNDVLSEAAPEVMQALQMK